MLYFWLDLFPATNENHPRGIYSHSSFSKFQWLLHSILRKGKIDTSIIWLLKESPRQMHCMMPWDNQHAWLYPARKDCRSVHVAPVSFFCITESPIICITCWVSICIDGWSQHCSLSCFGNLFVEFIFIVNPSSRLFNFCPSHELFMVFIVFM